MKVYFVRHGETYGNVGGYYQSPDTPLTPTGIKQAGQVAKRLSGRDIKLIYSSTHLRAVTTSEIIAKKLMIPIETWSSLMEIKRPSEVHGIKRGSEEIKHIESAMNHNFSVNGKKTSDEENFFDIKSRAQKVLDHLEEKHAAQDVVCVSHGTFIKTLTAVILLGKNLNPENFELIRRNLWAANTGITIGKHTKDSGWKITSWNDTSHL